MKKLIDFLDRNTEKIVLIAAIVLSLLSFFYYYNHGLIVAYGDARGHLDIARRVIDNLTPGLAQLGGVWLPLFHLLMLPTIWNGFMWHSGISGSLVNMPMYIASVFGIYKVIFLLTKNKLSSVLGCLILGLNINLLYMQSTPMTEAIFVALIIFGVYYLILWINTKNIIHLLISGFFFFLGCMTRYEAWPLTFCASIVVSITSFFTLGKKKTEGTIIIFGMLAFIGIILWILWQFAIFHNPLYFLNSEFSAKGQTTVSIAKGQVPTYKNFYVSLKAYFFSLVHVNGAIVLFLSLIGIFITIVKVVRGRLNKVNVFTRLSLLTLLVPGAFLVYALYKGNIPINVPEIATSTDSPPFFNIRYALYSLPALAVFSALVNSKKRIIQILLFVLVVINALLLIPSHGHQIATLEDAKNADIVEKTYAYDWIKRNYSGGYLLASAATSDPIIFGTNIDMKNFITEGSGKYWTESLIQPGKYANWVLITSDPRDMVNKHINRQNFLSEFFLAKNFGIFKIYRRKY